MPKNRLQLNFQLESAADRTKFVQDYLPTLKFELNEHELETISNYILWGKNIEGKNVQQEGTIKLKEWTTTPVESLEGLMEIPGFQESSIRSIQEPSTRIPRQVFSRKIALERAPDYLKDIYKNLFRQIDEIELIINYYELFVGRRKQPPRDKLIDKFTEEEQKYLNEKALRLTQYKYLKLRHLLVELRAEQYRYSDSYTNQIMSHNGSIRPIFEETTIWIGEDIPVLPLGTNTKKDLQLKIFPNGKFPAPEDFNEEELEKISSLIWKKYNGIQFDFRNDNHILELYKLRADLMDEQERDPNKLQGAPGDLVETLKYYEERAELSDLQKEILELKLRKLPNIQIAEKINQTYNKSYNDNYISTIFHQKIIPQIANAAVEHYDIMQNIFYPENFKKCKDCGRVLLLNTDNFVKQKKSFDGFSPRCKACEKIKRSKYK